MPRLGEQTDRKSEGKQKNRATGLAKDSKQSSGRTPADSAKGTKLGDSGRLASSLPKDNHPDNGGKPPQSRKVPSSLASTKKLVTSKPPNARDAKQNPADDTGPATNGSQSAEGEQEEGEGEEEGEEEDEEEDEPWSTLFVPELHSFFDDRVQVEAVYTNDLFHLARGGFNTNGAVRYRGNMDVTFTIDGERTFKTPGGTLLVYFQQGHGEGITNDFLGDVQVVSNIDARPLNQVSEYWWLQEFDNSWCKIGKQDANADFCVADLAVDFVHSSFGIMPNVLLPTFPDPGLGVSSF